jgi:hypothetical protein
VRAFMPAKDPQVAAVSQVVVAPRVAARRGGRTSPRHVPARRRLSHRAERAKPGVADSRPATGPCTTAWLPNQNRVGYADHPALATLVRSERSPAIGTWPTRSQARRHRSEQCS